MPEGPEIRRNAEDLKQAVGTCIAAVLVLSGRYMRKPISGLELVKAQTITRIEIRGKLIVFFCGDHAILSTAGMSGWWSQGTPYSKFRRIQLNTVLDRTGCPYVFTFVDMRNFGTFKVVTEAEALRKLATLGVDIFRDDDDVLDELEVRFRKYAGKSLICEALMEQKIFAGVGNYIRAEAMYLSGIDPRIAAAEITKDQLAKLWYNIHKVAQLAYQQGSDYKDLCYHRSVAEDGREVKKFTDKNGRTVWHV